MTASKIRQQHVLSKQSETNKSALLVDKRILPSKFGSSSISSPKTEKFDGRQQVFVDSRWEVEDMGHRQTSTFERYESSFNTTKYRLDSTTCSSYSNNDNSWKSGGSELNIERNYVLETTQIKPFSPTSKFATHLSANVLEDHFCESLMKERELEVNAINRKMHQVQDIYKDLAELISDQQDLIDNIDKKIEYAVVSTKEGVEQFEQARSAHENPIIEDPFGERIQVRKRKIENHEKHSNSCLMLLDSLKEDMQTFVGDLRSIFVSCAAPDIDAEQ